MATKVGGKHGGTSGREEKDREYRDCHEEEKKVIVWRVGNLLLFDKWACQTAFQIFMFLPID